MMNTIDFKIQRVTIAVTNMKKMLAFYTNVFEMRFIEQDMFGSKLYLGVLGELELLFCPAEIAGITTNQNRHQFEITATTIQKTVKLVTKYGGELMSEIDESNDTISVSIYDPDSNSIVLKQIL